MKIAINTLSLNKTKMGMGNYITHLVDEVTKDESHLFFIFIYSHTKCFFPEKKNIVYIIVPNIVGNSIVRIFFEQCILPLYILKYPIDLYHHPGFSLPFFCPCKSVVTIADMTFFSHSQYHLSKKNFYFKIMMPYAIKKADAVIAISESTKKDIIKYLPKNNLQKIIVTPLAQDDHFKPICREYAENILRKKYLIDNPFILFVGMLEPRKNIMGLIEAFSKINTNHLLIIVGKKGWLYDGLFSLVKEKKIEKKVLFMGYVPDEDLPYFYSVATVFVYPSFYEGFGIPILEAMACGCPVITSNNSSMKEIAEGVAMLVDPYIIEEIKIALLTMITNKKTCQNLAKKGLGHSKCFSWKKVGIITMQLYNSFKFK